MSTGRLEAFSDGVIAIVITVMVLDLKVPHGTGWAALRPVVPAFLTYVLSFVYLGIYWNNHHHMLRATERISGSVLWANLHLLFWLSLIPFVTGWMGQNDVAPPPTASYGVVLLCASIAYLILQTTILADRTANARLREALGRDVKGKISPVLYAVGISLSFVEAWMGVALYVAVALIWLVPDRRIERRLAS
jgi:uncharacterized membrane protein